MACHVNTARLSIIYKGGKMTKILKLSLCLLTVSLFMFPREVIASDEEAPDDMSNTNQVAVIDEFNDDANVDIFSPNPLFTPVDLPDQDVEKDLTSAQGYIKLLDEEEAPADLENAKTPTLSEVADKPTDSRKRAREDTAKALDEAFKELFQMTSALLAPKDPALTKYWDQLQKIKGIPHVYERGMQEFESLQNMPRGSMEAADTRKYLDWLCRMPWQESNPTTIDLKKARAALDARHSGLGKIKERIIEYLAVLKRVPDGNPPILCFVGPPGVGKTTLARAIAEATGRKFVRVSLGGVRDEAKIRGHLRAYVSARPGEILKSLADINSNNPVVLLDEVDKMTSESTQGDPAAALLEVLDREQNDKFKDHYLDLPFDLSNVMFIATANSYNIPGPLADRMEIIDLSSYTTSEKLAIARNNLVPKVMKENGLADAEFTISDPALEAVINGYTSEAGVRNLERCIGTLCRKTITKIEDGSITGVNLEPEGLKDYLGVSRVRPTKAFLKDKVGSTQGLAWTSVGGCLLPIEAKIVPGTGQVVATGNLGDVMRESATAAKVVLKWLAPQYGIKAETLNDKDIHIHAPEAAIKKDGPSAGVTITTSLMSALTGIPVRKDVAMTGEINLSGEVMPIGGLKEKLIAAHRAGLSLVLIPKDNEIDLEDVPDEVKRDLTIVPVEHISEVLEYALVNGGKLRK
jgi:ATP-dependent Lon protease